LWVLRLSCTSTIFAFSQMAAITFPMFASATTGFVIAMASEPISPRHV
jgi:K+-transporting ATPase A subunit